MPLNGKLFASLELFSEEKFPGVGLLRAAAASWYLDARQHLFMELAYRYSMPPTRSDHASFTAPSLALGVNTSLTILIFLKEDLPRSCFNVCFFNNQQRRRNILHRFAFAFPFIVT